MNIMSYLTPSFEDFVDAPVGADQLAHNSAGPGAEAGAAPAAVPGAEAPADSLEIPESTGPALVASADEVQAAAVVEDPGHSEAEAAAQQASDSNAAVIEQAQVAPAEASAGGDAGTVETPAEDPVVEEGTTDESADLGGDAGEDAGLDDGAAGGGDVGADVGGDDTGGDLGGETTEIEDAGSEDGLGGDESTDVGGEETGEAEVPTEEVEETGELEEDGLGEDAGAEEGGDDGLGDGAEGSEETGESEGEETGEEETETEGEEEASGEEESEESGEEESGSEEESEAGDEETDSDEDDGVDLDIPDVDTETTEDDVVEAEEEADEAVAEDEELDEEIVDTSKSVAELEGDVTSVENFIGVLQHGIRTKKFSAQTVALAQDKLQYLARKLDRESPVIPSMEDYTEKNLDAYYTNSLESFGSFLKKLKHVRDSFLDDFAKSMNEKMHLKAVETQCAAINKALDVQIVRVKDLTLEAPVSVKVPAALRGEGGPVKAVTAELQWLGEVAGIFAHDRKWLEAVSSLLAQAAKEGDSVKATGIINKALKVGLPSKAYPASVYTPSKLAKFGFEKVVKKPTGSMVQDMATLGERAIPESFQNDGGVGSGPESVDLKKTDLVKMLQLAKVLIGLSRGTAGAAGKGIVDSIDVVNRAKSTANQTERTGDKQSIAETDKARNALVTQFWNGLQNSSDNYSNFQWHLILLADNLVHLVQKVKGSAAAK
ncbi:virion structural protein [Pseudomonas phage D6]|nr:virion structural protein [Pseudomonas phage D6]